MAWKPTDVLPPAPMLPFQFSLVTVTELPDWVYKPPHILLMVWLPGKLNCSVQPDTAVFTPITILPINPFPH